MNQPDWIDIIEDILEMIEQDARASETNHTQEEFNSSDAKNDYSLDA